MAVTEVLESVRPIIRETVEKLALGEDWAFEVTLAIMPTPQGPAPVLLCYLHTAALHVLGQVLQQSFMMPIHLPPAVYEDAVTKNMAELRAQRSKLLTAGINGDNPAGRDKIIIRPGD